MATKGLIRKVFTQIDDNGVEIGESVSVKSFKNTGQYDPLEGKPGEWDKLDGLYNLNLSSDETSVQLNAKFGDNIAVIGTSIEEVEAMMQKQIALKEDQGVSGTEWAETTLESQEASKAIGRAFTM